MPPSRRSAAQRAQAQQNLPHMHQKRRSNRENYPPSDHHARPLSTGTAASSGAQEPLHDITERLEKESTRGKAARRELHNARRREKRLRGSVDRLQSEVADMKLQQHEHQAITDKEIEGLTRKTVHLHNAVKRAQEE